jgi:hypothetical protein
MGRHARKFDGSSDINLVTTKRAIRVSRAAGIRTSRGRRQSCTLGVDAVQQRLEMFRNHSRAPIVKHTVVPAGHSVV